MPLLFKKIRDVLRHGLVIQTALDALRRLGVEITPYYLVEETVPALPVTLPIPDLPNLTSRLLGPGDLPAVGAMPESRFSEAQARVMLEQGMVGLGCWSDAELVAFTWVNPREFDFAPCRFGLKEDEAYLFGATTSRRYRGRNLSPFMRHALYEHLAGEGRGRLYSISYAFNKPAIRFKRKLNARFTRLYLYVNLWNLWRRNWLLKNHARN